MVNEKRLIDANALLGKLNQHHDLFVDAWADCDNLPKEEKARIDEILNCMAEVVNAPTVDAVVLPCKVGDPVFVITYCRCGNPECYENRHCHKKETKRTPKVLAGAMVQQKGKKYNWDKFTYERSWVWEPVGTICYRVFQRPFDVSMLPYIGIKVFLTLDEARKGVVLMSMGERSEGE